MIIKDKDVNSLRKTAADEELRKVPNFESFRLISPPTLLFVLTNFKPSLNQLFFSGLQAGKYNIIN